MANRRMFSKDIVRSDAFLDLPISSQALYFHLGMEADDRGYVSNPKTVIRTVGSTVGDLEQLASRKFILIRGEGLILIKGWRINNQIQPSRLVETKFTDDLKKLFFDENNSYTEKETENPVLSVCRQNVDGLSTQDSIGKLSIDKSSNSISIKDVLDELDEPLFPKAFVQKLIDKNFLTDNDVNDIESYLSLFKCLCEKYDIRNINISFNYVMQHCVRYKCENCWMTADEEPIDNKYSYFSKAITDNCEAFDKEKN